MKSNRWKTHLFRYWSTWRVSPTFLGLLKSMYASFLSYIYNLCYINLYNSNVLKYLGRICIAWKLSTYFPTFSSFNCWTSSCKPRKAWPVPQLWFGTGNLGTSSNKIHWVASISWCTTHNKKPSNTKDNAPWVESLPLGTELEKTMSGRQIWEPCFHSFLPIYYWT